MALLELGGLGCHQGRAQQPRSTAPEGLIPAESYRPARKMLPGPRFETRCTAPGFQGFFIHNPPKKTDISCHASLPMRDSAGGAAQVDPELEGPTLPSQREDEFRPFVRRLPEFKFWCGALLQSLL